MSWKNLDLTITENELDVVTTNTHNNKTIRERLALECTNTFTTAFTLAYTRKTTLSHIIT